jgi:hypothetical protein
MMINASRHLLHAVCVAGLCYGTAASAQSIQLDLNNGRIGVGPTEERRGPAERYDDRRRFRDNNDDRVRFDCNDGRQIVRSRGFRNVQTLDCGSSRHVYAARERGSRVEVTVSARSGQIVSVQPL